MGAKMKAEVLGYLLEEYDHNGLLVWKIMSWNKPDLVWLNEIRSKKHNLKITELITGQVEHIYGVKIYDSSKFVVGL